MSFLDIAAFADVPYEISRFILRFASVMFLTYVLTLVISLALTWRPRRVVAAGGVGDVRSARVSAAAEGSEPAPAGSLRREEIEPGLLKVGDGDNVAEVAEPESVPSWKREIDFSTAEVQK